MSLFLQEGCAINVDAKLPHRQKPRALSKAAKNPRRRDRWITACTQEVALIADYVSGEMKPARRDAFEA
ncbi:MAG TPA: hypothetical protein VH985_19655, partial [Candidatus Binatia bacterium]